MKVIQLLFVLSLFSRCSLDMTNSIVLELEKLPEKVDYNYHVKPILSDRCYQCHGPDEKTRKAGLRLDIEKIAFSKLESGSRAFSKGNLNGSESIHRILSTDPEIQMPPPESNLSLSPKEKAILIQGLTKVRNGKNIGLLFPHKKRALKFLKNPI